MRILMVAEQYPWPAVDGYRQRLGHVIGGLARAGEVEILTLDRRPVGLEVEPADVSLPDAVVSTRSVAEGPPIPPQRWFAQWVRSDVPRRLLSGDLSALHAAVADRVASSDQVPVDLIWYSHVDTWWTLHGAAEGRGIAEVVDFDNLENLALRLRRRTPARFAPGDSLLARLRTATRWIASRGFDLVDERRWDSIQRRCADSVEHVVVCSDLDVGRSGCTNAVVIGNGSTAPPAPRIDRGALHADGPVLFFVGALDYEPNTEAVEWFVREVLDLVRSRRPDVRLRIAGRGTERVSWVAERAGVELLGPVPDLAVELEAADVSIVPIRVGAGTRLKVVEALANHLPLVTTTVGCEGIALIHDEHALIADDAQSFAQACVALLESAEERQRLADAGAELFSAHYDWTRIEAQTATLAAETVQLRSRTTAGE